MTERRRTSPPAAQTGQAPTGAAPQPRSYRFRQERQSLWLNLESLLDQIRLNGLSSLSADELHLLPALYRGTISSLSIARTISLDGRLIQYLESLSARGYLTLYATKLGFWQIVGDFLNRRLNRAIYDARWSLAASTAALLIGTVCGFLLVQDDSMRFYAYVDAGLAAGRGPASTCGDLQEVLYSSGELDTLSNLAAYLFTHNARIGMACFALGFAAGIPVLLLLFTNGLMIGAFWSIYASCGQALSFWAWSMGHGVTELLAVCLCGAAGLEIGRSILLPGRRSRRAAAAEAGRRGALIVLGAVILFLIAGLIEGFFRQLVLDETWRGLMAVSTAVLWAAYIARGWQEKGQGLSYGVGGTSGRGSAVEGQLLQRTPEGVTLTFPLADPAARFKAFLVDLMIVALLTWLIGSVAAFAKSALEVRGLVIDALTLVSAFLLRNFYFAWFELRWRGNTPGKRGLGLRTVARDGGPLTADMVFARNLTREAELFLPAMMAFAPEMLGADLPSWVRVSSLVWIGVLLCFPLLNKRRARIGDLLAGTVVVVTPKSELLPDLAARQARKARYQFTPEMLDIYGEHELKVLEEILRREFVDDKLLEEISARIRKKIGWPADQEVWHRPFLNAFYAAQRARLEQHMLMGERRTRKRF